MGHIYISDKLVAEGGVVSVKGAGMLKLSKCSGSLKSMGSPALPAEYKKFLGETDGYTRKELEFYGTGAESINSTTLDSIVKFNTYLRLSGYDMGSLLFLGKHGDGIFYVYDEKSSAYRSVDSKSLAVIEQFPDFHSMFRAANDKFKK